MPTISVIIPVYNVQQYLNRCVDSITAQSFSDFELILVDDGSTNSDGATCDQVAERDSRAIVIHKENGGVSTARNAGLEVCCGSYATFCDSDDYWSKDRLEVFGESLNQNKSDIISTDYTIVGRDYSEKLVRHRSKGNFSFGEMSETVDFIIWEVLSGRLGWEIWTKLFRAEIIKEQRIRFCETCENFAEDLGFLIEYALYCRKITAIEYSGYYYYRHPESMMGRTVGKIKPNAGNEVSKQFWKRLVRETNNPDVQKYFSVIFSCIIRNVISHGGNYDNYQTMREYRSIMLRNIVDISFFNQQARGVLQCGKLLRSLYGRDMQIRIQNDFAYFLSGNTVAYLFGKTMLIAYNIYLKVYQIIKREIKKIHRVMNTLIKKSTND